MDDRQKKYEDEREQARACGCPSCRAKYNLPPQNDHDSGAGWLLIGGVLLGAVSTALLTLANGKQAA